MPREEDFIIDLPGFTILEVIERNPICLQPSCALPGSNNDPYDMPRNGL